MTTLGNSRQLDEILFRRSHSLKAKLPSLHRSERNPYTPKAGGRPFLFCERQTAGEKQRL